MAHIFNYAVLTAIPDQRRGERVNVGVVVFLPDRLDVRFPEVRKIRVLQNGNWERYAADVQQLVDQAYRQTREPKSFVDTFSLLGGVIRCSELAWFSIDVPEQYQQRVDEIVSTLVQRARPESRPPTTRLNTEIATTFRRAKLLAPPRAPSEMGKVQRNFLVSTEDDLTADFGFRNGRTHVIATLELRGAAVDKGRAAVKAITLHRAKETFDAHRIGVYAAPHDAAQFRPHVHLLTEYADETYNWADPSQRTRYLHSVYRDIQAPPGTLIS